MRLDIDRKAVSVEAQLSHHDDGIHSLVGGKRKLTFSENGRQVSYSGLDMKQQTSKVEYHNRLIRTIIRCKFSRDRDMALRVGTRGRSSRRE